MLITLNGRKFSTRGDREYKTLSDQEKLDVWEGRLTCPQCFGMFIGGYYTDGSSDRKGYEPDTHRSEHGDPRVECSCFRDRWIYDIWKSKVGPNVVRLSTLKADESKLCKASPEFQAKVIAYLQHHAFDSFLLLGRTGMGKTTMSDALYRVALVHAIKRAPIDLSDLNRIPLNLWRIKCSTLLDEQHTYKMNKESGEDNRQVSPEMISRTWWDCPRLFIGELDKVRPFTVTKKDNLHEIFDALTSRLDRGLPAQVVADTNLPWSSLSSEENLGPHLARRFEELCHRIDYFAEKIFSPTKKLANFNTTAAVL